jgi:predicted transcriptional regulator YheO
MLHCLDCYDTEKNIGWIDKITMLKAEKLSNYFIAMSKKIKISMLESKGLIEIVASMKGEPVEQIVKQIFASNPDASKIEVAEILNISKRTVYNYLKK